MDENRVQNQAKSPKRFAEYGLFIATIVLAVSSLISNKLTRDQIKDSEITTDSTFAKQDRALLMQNITSHIENRAYINIVQKGFVTKYNNTNYTIDGFQCEILNTGTTPANRINIYWNCDSRGLSSTIEFTKLKDSAKGIVLGPNESTIFFPTPNEITPWFDFFTAKKSLYVYGLIIYNDFSNHSDTTKFYYRMIPSCILSPRDSAYINTQKFIGRNDINIRFSSMDKYNEEK